MVAGKLLIAACQRHLDDLARAKRDRAWGYYFDAWHGNDVCGFIERLPHVEGKWATPTLQLEPWQMFILVAVFGWRRREDGLRRFTTAYIEIARKNAKSTLTAGVALYCLCCEDEPGAQCLVAATTGSQAWKVFGPAKQMVERAAMVGADGVRYTLRETYQLEPWAKRITCSLNGGWIEPINSRSTTQDGWNPHLVIIDELHAHKDRGLFDVLRSARGARRNPLSWYITTAGFDVNTVCYEQRELVTKILDRSMEADHYFGVVFAPEPDASPFAKHTWLMANPNWGVSVKITEFEAHATEARNSPKSLGEFRTKQCNLWSGAAGAWLSLPKWDQCARPGLSLEQFVGQPCWIGGDLSDSDDITAIALVFEDGDDLVVFPRFYLPKDLVDARDQVYAQHYRAWADGGHMVLTDADTIDMARVEKDILDDFNCFDIRAVTLERYGAQQLAINLTAAGLPAAIEGKSAKACTEALREIEDRVRTKRILHGGHPCMRWMVSNAVAKLVSDREFVVRKPSPQSPLKIDGVDAMMWAVSAWQRRGETSSVYDSQGITVL